MAVEANKTATNPISKGSYVKNYDYLNVVKIRCKMQLKIVGCYLKCFKPNEHTITYYEFYKRCSNFFLSTSNLS